MSLSTLKLMYEKDIGTDVTLTVKGDKRKLKAHRFVLMNASKYFKTLLAAKTEDDTHCVNNDMSFETLEAMIKFMYTRQFDQVNELTEEKIKAILVASASFNLTVHEQLRVRIVKILTVSNVCSFYDFEISKNDLLHSSIDKFLFRNILEIRLEPSFLRKPKHFVISTLNHINVAAMTETEVFETIKHWINHDYVNRHQDFPELLKCVWYYRGNPNKITVDYAMTDMLKWCTCKDSKRWIIHLLALMAGYKDKGVVNVEARVPFE